MLAILYRCWGIMSPLAWANTWDGFSRCSLLLSQSEFFLNKFIKRFEIISKNYNTISLALEGGRRMWLSLACSALFLTLFFLYHYDVWSDYCNIKISSRQLFQLALIMVLISVYNTCSHQTLIYMHRSHSDSLPNRLEVITYYSQA